MDQFTIAAELKKFFSSVCNFNDSSNLPLVIVENNETILSEHLWMSVSDNIKLFSLDNPNIFESLVEKIIECQKANLPLVIEIETDPNPSVISLFSQVADRSTVTETDESGQKHNLFLRIPIISVINRELLENRISYPNFLNLFGPGLSIK
jgi:hypothetical protein